MSKHRKTATRIATLAGAVALTGAGLVLFGMPGHAQSGPPQKDMTIDKAMRSEVVESRSLVFMGASDVSG